jgi:hypothetical protein
MTQPGPAEQGPAPVPSSDGRESPTWPRTQAPPEPPRPRRRPGWWPLRIATVVVVVLALIGGAISVWGHGGRQSSPAAPATAASGASTTTVATTSQAVPAGIRVVESDVERLRGLRFRRPVPVTVESPSKVAAQLLRELDSDTDKADVRRQGRALALLGEVPASTDLYQLLRSVQAESVLGFYVPGKPPAKGRLYVRSDHGLDPFTRFVLSHELTHAVTDQHYDLTLADRLESANASDRAAAYSGLLEGDATVTMQRYFERVLSPDEQATAAQVAASQSTAKMDAAPAAVREYLEFPYSAGAAFVNALYRRGGWDAVNRAYRDPPTSTEQLLHPERYLDRRDQPQTLHVPDLHAALGSGWRQGTHTEWGEFDARVLLESAFPVTTAERAAAGWDGGELRTFERGKRTAMVLRTVWDSPGEAGENCTAMSRWATVRFGSPTASDRWSTPVQQGALLCQGAHVAWLSAPDSASLDRLVRGLGSP